MVVQHQQKKSALRKSHYRTCRPAPDACKKRLTKNILDTSLQLGTQFMLRHQKTAGNFNYEYNWITKTFTKSDNQVRQAGALWGLSLIYHDSQNKELLTAVEKGFRFFDQYAKESADGRKWITYPHELSGKTGTVALVSLAIIELLREPEFLDIDFQKKIKSNLSIYLNFLVSLKAQNGHFHKSFTYDEGIGFGRNPSPYFDGETLLALVKAAKYLGRNDLKPLILESAEAVYNEYVTKARKQDPDSKKTKGFFQWGSMLFFELATSGWPGTETYSDKVIELADWMIDVHCMLDRTRNTAYALEGIIHAYELARQSKDQKQADRFACIIDLTLYKLTSWQVKGPLQNAYLRTRYIEDELAVGGILNHKKKPKLRIDVAQHQMHAVLLARRYLYTFPNL